MRQFFDICHGKPIEGSEKKAWTKLGTMMVDGENRAVIFDYAPPLGDWLTCFEKQSRE